MLRRIAKLMPLVFVMLMAVTTVRASTVVVLDNSPKASAFLQQQLVEVKALLAQLPDGERLAIVRAAPTSRTIFDGVLGSETRLNLGATLASVRAAKTGADLGAALAVASSLAAREGGAKRIVILTAGLPQPPPRSAFFGKSLEELLKDAKLVPDDARVLVRLYGDASLNVTRTNLSVIRNTPRWQNELASADSTVLPQPPAEDVQREPSPIKQRFSAWVVAGLLTLAAMAALGLGAWRQRGVRAAKLRLEEEQRRMLNSAASVAAEEDVQEKERLVFNVDVGEEEFALDDGKELIAGDRWDASVFFAAAGACVRFSANSGALNIDNVGVGTVNVGTLPLPSGESKRLPARYIEVTVGGRVISVSPEILPAGESAAAGADNSERQTLSAREDKLEREGALR